MEFVIGDWLVYGEQNFAKSRRVDPGRYKEALRMTGIYYGVLLDYAYVSRNVSLSVRTDKLSWFHHRLIARLKPEKQKHWIDLATNAESLGMNVIRIAETPNAIADLSAAMKVAKTHPTATLIHINSDPLLYAPGGEAWWEVPIPEISTLESTQKAFANYKEARKVQKKYLGKGSVERN
jgi:TPP-dependent trihydroxycyclohexane-1,2-dione (THcHDO) dehydratase